MRQASALNRMSVYPFLQLASAVAADMPVGSAVQAIDFEISPKQHLFFPLFPHLAHFFCMFCVWYINYCLIFFHSLVNGFL
jgi:hypothetical protein